MKNLNVNNIVEAKAEYTKQLQSVMTEPIYNKLISIYNACEAMPNEEKQNTLIEVQKKMQEVPNWNTYNIESLSRDVTKNCSYFSDLLAAVFVSNVKILSSIRMGKTNKRVQIKMPSNENFIHNVFVRVAEEVFENPRMLKKDAISFKKEIYIIIHEAIHNTIRTLLPLQNILQNYMADDSDDSEAESDEPEDEPMEDPMDEPDEPEEEYDAPAPVESLECDTEPTPAYAAPVPAAPAPANNDFFDNEHETKQVTIQDKNSYRESPFDELDDTPEDDIKT